MITKLHKHENYFTIKTKKEKKNEEIIQSDRITNTITDIGYNRCYGLYGNERNPILGLGTSNIFLGLGTGTSPIKEDAVSLGNLFVRSPNRPTIKNVGVSEVDGNLFSTKTYVFVWPFGHFDGDIISEVGIYLDDNNEELICGQLIRDSNGTPTTITVLSDEQLIVEYTVFWPMIDFETQLGSGNININGVDVGVSFSTIHSVNSPSLTTYRIVDETFSFFPPRVFEKILIITETDEGRDSFNLPCRGNTTVNFKTGGVERIMEFATDPYNMQQDHSIKEIHIPHISTPNGMGDSIIIAEFDTPIEVPHGMAMEFEFKWLIKWRDE